MMTNHHVWSYILFTYHHILLISSSYPPNISLSCQCPEGQSFRFQSSLFEKNLIQNFSAPGSWGPCWGSWPKASLQLQCLELAGLDQESIKNVFVIQLLMPHLFRMKILFQIKKRNWFVQNIVPTHYELWWCWFKSLCWRLSSKAIYFTWVDMTWIKHCYQILQSRKLTDVKIGGDEAWVVGDGDVRPLNILETSRFTWLLANPAQLHLRIEQRSHFLLQDLIGAVRQPQGHSTILGMNLYKLFGKFVSGL